MLSNQNPLSSLTVEELTNFQKAIDSNFRVITNASGVVTLDYKARWCDLFDVLTHYVYDNYQVLNVTHGFSGLTYGGCANYLITVELSKRQN